MTRLTERDIHHIAQHLDEYEAHLKRITGSSLRQIACRGAGVDEARLVDLMDRVRFAAVPVSGGLGVIGGFCDTVAAIVSHLGFETFVTEGCDVAGIAEGIEGGADILMFADDNRFVAICPARKQVVDNTRATAHGFVAGLELMNGGVAGESVLVLGCGPLGVAATKALIYRGANVVLCDIEQERALAALGEVGEVDPVRVRVDDASHTAIEDYGLIFDATNAGAFIEPTDLTPRTLVAAPGMPCALTTEAMTKHGDRVLHDALEIGTATMAVQAAGLAAGADIKKADKE